MKRLFALLLGITIGSATTASIATAASADGVKNNTPLAGQPSQGSAPQDSKAPATATSATTAAPATTAPAASTTGTTAAPKAEGHLSFKAVKEELSNFYTEKKKLTDEYKQKKDALKVELTYKLKALEDKLSEEGRKEVNEKKEKYKKDRSYNKSTQGQQAPRAVAVDKNSGQQ